MNHLMKSQFFRRTAQSYLLILLIPIIIFGIILYNQINTANKNRLRTEYEKKFENIAGIIDKKFEELNILSYTLRASTWLPRTYSNSTTILEYFNATRKNDIFQLMKVYDTIAAVTDTMTVVLPQKEICINQNGWYDLDIFFRSRGILKEKDKKILLNAFKAAPYFQLVNLKQLGLSCAEENDIAIIQNLDMMDTPRGILFIPFKSDLLSNYIEQFGFDELLRFSIISEDRAIYTYVAKQTGQGKNTFNYTRTMHSAVHPWNYRITFSVPIATNSFSDFSLLFSSLFFTLSLGVVLSIFLALITYKPLQHLMKKIDIQYTGASDRWYEFKAIERTLDKLVVEKKELSALVNQYYNIARTNQLVNLLRGYFVSSEIQSHLAQYKIEYNDTQYFQVIICSISGDKLFDAEPDLEVFLNMKVFLLSQNISFELLQLSNKNFVIIFNFSDKTEGNKIEKIINSLQQYIKDKLNIPLSSSYGTIELGLIGISKSYQNAKEESTVHFFDKVINPITTKKKSSVNYYYPTDWEIQLINHLKLGNTELAIKIINELNRENAERNLPNHLKIRITYLIFETMVRVIDELNIDMQEYIDNFQKNITGYTDEKQWEFLRTMAEQICGRASYSNYSQTTTLGNKLLQYVEENFQNYSLSLKDLSNAFNISVSTASRTFKSVVKINFYNYLCRIRMEKAKEYFRMGECNITEIANKVGYENEASFRRAFTRYEGITPKEYIQKYTVKS